MAGRPLVVVVDDEQDLLLSLQELLEDRLQYPVLTAPSASEALTLLAALPGDRVNLILSDYRMGTMNGLEFLETVRATHPTVPRVLMTAYPDMDLAIRAINDARITRFLRKPLDPDATIRLVEALTRQHVQETHRQAALQRAVWVSRDHAAN